MDACATTRLKFWYFKNDTIFRNNYQIKDYTVILKSIHLNS